MLLAATWNWMLVLVGVVAFHDSVPHVGVVPLAGFASLMPETKLPEVAKPVFIVTLKPRSFWVLPVAPVHAPPLLVEVARRPPA